MRGLAMLMVLLTSVTAFAQTADTIAIVHAEVWPGDGPAVQDATVVIRGEEIVSITPGGPAPAGATRIDATGKILTPGFIATESPLGLVEIELEATTRDESPENDDADPVRAAFSSADGINPASTVIRVTRMGGITSAVVAPTGGFIAGRSAFIDLAGRTPASMIVNQDIALHVNLDDSGVSSVGGAFPSALSRLREVVTDAQTYARGRAAYQRRGMRELGVSLSDLEALLPALRKDVPTVVRVSRASEIVRVLELADTFDLVLSGAEEGWRVADEIANANVPVIVHPLENLPSTFTRLGARFDNAKRLADAGVKIILTTPGAHDQRNLRQEAGNAIAHGLTREQALRAITRTPAEVFGQDERGVIARDKIANVVLWDADPFELTSVPTQMWIRGHEVALRSRQTALLERYRDLADVRRGPPRAIGPQ